MKHSIKKQLTQILDICIDKQLTYELAPYVFMITVRDDYTNFRYSAYYHGQLYNVKMSSIGQITLSELLKKVKEY